MKVVITGASGFIGRRILAALLAGSHDVHVLGRTAPQTAERLHFYRWNALTGHPPEESLAEAAAVLHLAGEPVAQRWTPEAKRRIYDSRILGTRHLVQALSTISRRPQVLISTSASGYYGDRGEEALTESSPSGAGFLAGLSMQWEKEALMAESLGMRVALMRVSLVLGRDGGALQKMLTPFRLGLGGRLGSGRQWWPWIHVDDLAALYLLAIENANLNGPMNASSPNPVTNAEFTRTLAGILHRPALFPAPRFVLKLALGELAEIVLASQRMEPLAARRARFQFRFPELAGALRDLLQ